MVSDRIPYIKHWMFHDYKGKKFHPKASRYFSLKSAHSEHVKDINGTYIAFKGYEADDIAFALCRELSDKFSNIYLFSTDHDWLINVVDNDNIFLIMWSTNGDVKVGSRKNFSDILTKDKVSNLKNKFEFILFQSISCFRGIWCLSFICFCGFLPLTFFQLFKINCFYSGLFFFTCFWCR